MDSPDWHAAMICVFGRKCFLSGGWWVENPLLWPCRNQKKKKKTEVVDILARLVGWLLACLTSQQHASVSQGRFCSDNFTCCHTEIEVADQTFHLTQSQYTDSGPTSPITDHITPGAWQGSHWSAIFKSVV